MSEQEEMKIMPMLQQSKVFTQEVRGVQYTCYLTGPIEEPEHYVELCNILRSCGPQDEVILRINSRGGLVSSERMIVNAIRECQGSVKGFIEYDCMSAATGIFLACDSHGWGEHIQFMAHCSWWGSIGKNPDIKSQTEFGIKQMEEEINTTYSGLLSPEELQQCNDGKEFWFGSKELEERILKYHEHQQILKENCDCPECQSLEEEDESLDLMAVIEQNVAEGVEKALGNILKKYDLVEKPKPVKQPRKKKVASKEAVDSKEVVDKSVEGE